MEQCSYKHLKTHLILHTFIGDFEHQSVWQHDKKNSFAQLKT